MSVSDTAAIAEGSTVTLDVKDIVYLLVYVISVVSVYYAQRNRIGNLEKENSQIKSIIYGDRGKLNIIDHDSCKRYRDEVFAAVRRNEQVNEMLLNEIKEINKNVLQYGFKIDALLKDWKKLEKNH